MILPQNSSSARQQGAALMVAIVLLVMLSLLGVASMRGATLERIMTNNAIFIAEVFQFAESSTDIALNDSSNMGAAFTLNGQPLQIASAMDHNSAVQTEAELRYVGDGHALGYSFGSGSSNFMSLRYEVQGRASMPEVRAGAQVEQGAYRVVPSP